MKTLSLLTALCAAMVTLATIGCGSPGSKNQQEEKASEQGTVQETPQNQGTQPKDILQSYLKIKGALVKSDVSGAASQADILAHQLSKDTYPDILHSVDQISHSESLEQQRVYFNALSQQVLGLLDEKSPLEGPVYKQYCPMAFDNEGAFWLSGEKEIMNPYFGDKMLHCGSVEATLK